PDHRAALAWAAGAEPFRPLPFRIDLGTGAVAQLGGFGTGLDQDLLSTDAVVVANVRRWWRRSEWNAASGRFVHNELFDLTTGEGHPVAFDDDHLVVALTPAERAAIVAEARAATRLRAPGNCAAWIEGDEVCFAAAHGVVERVPLGRPVSRRVSPAGHGFLTFGNEVGLYDLTLRRWRPFAAGYLVRGELLECKGGHWQKCSADGVVTPLPELRNAALLGLLDDDCVLMQRYTLAAGKVLFTFRVADAKLAPLPLPAGVHGSWLYAPPGLAGEGSLLARDPRGGVWLSFGRGSSGGFLRLDPTTMSVRRVLPRDAELPWYQDERLLAFPDDHSALLQSGGRIVRVDVDSGARTVLFPR
ncbi:MAG: hypothetical protein K8J09_19630, partial [Planctomycetes bacterium]|nr:hypothetical protein [Planctomycetota bacterium]